MEGPGGNCCIPGDPFHPRMAISTMECNISNRKGLERQHTYGSISFDQSQHQDIVHVRESSRREAKVQRASAPQQVLS